MQRATLMPAEPLVATGPRRTVAIHGDFAVIGDPWRTTQFGQEAGAAYVYRRIGGRWEQQAEFFGWDLESRARFGSAIAITDDMIVVGAPNHGDGGAVFCYPASSGTWIEQGYPAGTGRALLRPRARDGRRDGICQPARPVPRSAQPSVRLPP